MSMETECGCNGNDIRISPEYRPGIEVLSRAVNELTTEESYSCRCRVCHAQFEVTAHHGYHFPQYFYPLPPCNSTEPA